MWFDEVVADSLSFCQRGLQGLPAALNATGAPRPWHEERGLNPRNPGTEGKEGHDRLNQSENRRSLASADEFDGIFEMVKAAAEERLGMHRAGLSLVLGDIPNSIGAYHEMGSNAIVMNRNLLRAVGKLSRSRDMKNSYVFMILLHEYLHSLGYADDAQVRRLGKEITEEYLGGKHMAAEMAVRPLDSFFPDLASYAAFRDRGDYETVRRFDSSSTPYIA